MSGLMGEVEDLHNTYRPPTHSLALPAFSLSRLLIPPLHPLTAPSAP